MSSNGAQVQREFEVTLPIGYTDQEGSTHRRVVLLAWFNGRPGSIFNLHSKPRSASAYRKYISSLGS